MMMMMFMMMMMMMMMMMIYYIFAGKQLNIDKQNSLKGVFTHPLKKKKTSITRINADRKLNLYRFPGAVFK